MNRKNTSTVTLMVAGKKKTYNAPAKWGTKTCKAFNFIRCFKGHTHLELQHAFSFCLATTNRVFPPSKNSCNCKKAQAQTQNS